MPLLTSNWRYKASESAMSIGERWRARWLTSFARPESTTYLIFGIVMAVSATLVAMTTRRVLGGGSAKTLICLSVGNSEYSGKICIGSEDPVTGISVQLA